MSQPIERRSFSIDGWKLNGRWRMALAIGCIWCAIALWVDAEKTALRNPSFSTGYLLFGAVLFLASYQLRKKIPTIAWGTSRTWMQLHLGVAWSSIGAFLFHAGLRLPTGGLDTLLFVLFVLVSSSGVWGLILTRSIPRRLAAMGNEMIFERIPGARHAAAEEARTIVLQSTQSTEVIANFYRDSLGLFFEGPRSPWYFIRPSGSLRRSLQQKADALDRYLSETDRQTRDRLRELILHKDELDYQSALQLRLKTWLFLHIGFTYGLLIVSVYHALVVHAFHGGG